jgi:hypothetical protein
MVGMNSARYEELLARLFENELSGAEAEEMADGLDASETLRQDLRRHLVLWELWSQQQAPERSEDAFVRAWKMRLRAEAEDSDAFPDTVRAQLEARRSRPDLMESIRRFFATRRPVRMRWAAALANAGRVLVRCFAGPRSAQAVTTLKGEAVCTACVLHESDEHAPAIRVIAGSATIIYYLDRNPTVAALQGYFCYGPSPVTAEGKVRTEANRRRFEARTVTIPDGN